MADLYVIVHKGHSFGVCRELVYDVHPDSDLAAVAERAAGLEKDAHRYGRPRDKYRVARLVFDDEPASVTPRTGPAAVYGPHCSHSECSYIACDLVADDEPGVLFGCRSQSDCPYCGPTSADWPRLSADWIAWCIHNFGTAKSDALRRTRAGDWPTVIATAELVEANPVTAS